MPKTAAAVLGFAVIVASIGYNTSRYPVVWEMVGLACQDLPAGKASGEKNAPPAAAKAPPAKTPVKKSDQKPASAEAATAKSTTPKPAAAQPAAPKPAVAKQVEAAPAARADKTPDSTLAIAKSGPAKAAPAKPAKAKAANEKKLADNKKSKQTATAQAESGGNRTAQTAAPSHTQVSAAESPKTLVAVLPPALPGNGKPGAGPTTGVCRLPPVDNSEADLINYDISHLLVGATPEYPCTNTP